MTHRRTPNHLRIGLALVFVLALGALAGCSSSKSSTTSAATTPPPSSTARGAYAIAVAAVATVAPDGKLLVAQSADAITATSTPGWQFLIGSPKNDTIYAVSVGPDGKPQSSIYGTASLSADEWASVPAASEWKIDSPAAHDKALTVYPNGKSVAYFMGFVSYIPKGSASTTKPMTWVIAFNPDSQGNAATSTVDVNVTTGATALATK